tara:strand:+ start:120 stop:440 length:321 start_codon:yes stop_codon:yes gene_type:complete
MIQKPIKLVMIRRGATTTPNVSTQKLVSFIRKRVLLGADEISSDGKNWIRVDRHYQLKEFFSKEDSQKNVLKVTNDLSNEVEISVSPPDLENELQEVANLLREINK